MEDYRGQPEDHLPVSGASVPHGGEDAASEGASSLRVRSLRLRQAAGHARRAEHVNGTLFPGAVSSYPSLARSTSAVALTLPAAIQGAPGIFVQGRLIKSLVFSTDAAVICHCDADAVFAVYPFACQPLITKALMTVANRPVFTGVGGAVTKGSRCVDMALHAEMQGISGVVLNATVAPSTVEAVATRVDLPVVVTVCDLDDRAFARIGSGASIVNVAAGPRTESVTAELRRLYPDLPIMATGGPNAETIGATIAAGADAISWTPPTTQELERIVMDKARSQISGSDSRQASA